MIVSCISNIAIMSAMLEFMFLLLKYGILILNGGRFIWPPVDHVLAYSGNFLLWRSNFSPGGQLFPVAVNHHLYL